MFGWWNLIVQGPGLAKEHQTQKRNRDEVNKSDMHKHKEV